MNTFKHFILSNRKKVTLFIIISSLIAIFIPAIIVRKLNSSLSYLEIVYYISQIVSSIFVITGVVIAAWQYYLSSSAEIQNLEVSQVQRAIELSEFYKEKILKPYNAIYYVYKECGVLGIIDNIDQKEMKIFDISEMRRLIKESDIEKLKKMETSEKFFKAVLDADAIFGLKLHRVHQINEETIEEKKGITVKVDPGSVLSSFLSGIVNNMLNDLEYFAMHFAHKTADESVVFQSLHQTYNEIIKVMYYNIANTNQPWEGKYYTNVIELYNIWFQRSEKQKKEMEKNRQHITDPGTVINKGKG